MIIKPKVKIRVNQPVNYHPQLLPGFEVVRDTREQLGYEFKGVDCVDKKLEWGDYSVVGFEPKEDYHEPNLNAIIIGLEDKQSGISIERKSLSDFYGSITDGRDRFKRMLCGFRDYVEFKGLVIEGGESEVLCPELSGSEMYPNSVYGTLVSIELRYNTHIYYGSRQACELKVLSWLSYYYKIKTEGDGDKIKKVESKSGGIL